MIARQLPTSGDVPFPDGAAPRHLARGMEPWNGRWHIGNVPSWQASWPAHWQESVRCPGLRKRSARRPTPGSRPERRASARRATQKKAAFPHPTVIGPETHLHERIRAHSVDLGRHPPNFGWKNAAQDPGRINKPAPRNDSCASPRELRLDGPGEVKVIGTTAGAADDDYGMCQSATSSISCVYARAVSWTSL